MFDEGELAAEATVKNFLTVRQEGTRQVSRNLEYYNLDAIISVGYRVKSRVARSQVASSEVTMGGMSSVCQVLSAVLNCGV